MPTAIVAEAQRVEVGGRVSGAVAKCTGGHGFVGGKRRRTGAFRNALE